MKRSEALSLIKKHLKYIVSDSKFLGDDYLNIDKYYDAESNFLLAKLEEKGMSPPHIDDMFFIERGKNTVSLDEMKRVLSNRKWEEE